MLYVHVEQDNNPSDCINIEFQLVKTKELKLNGEQVNAWGIVNREEATTA